MSDAPTSYGELADVLEHLPLLVRESRRRRGLSIRAAAREMGMSFSTVLRYEDGGNVHLDHAVAMLRWVDDDSGKAALARHALQAGINREATS